MDVEGKVAIVSGAASGLGRATAAALASEGARVAIIDLNEAAVKAAADEMGTYWLACDVADASASEAEINQIEDALGTPHVLVNCAGIAPVSALSVETAPVHWRISNACFASICLAPSTGCAWPQLRCATMLLPLMASAAS